MWSICGIETNLEVPIMISSNQALHLCKSCIEEMLDYLNSVGDNPDENEMKLDIKIKIIHREQDIEKEL